MCVFVGGGGLEGKGKVFPVHFVKVHRGSVGIAPLILNTRTEGGEYIN